MLHISACYFVDERCLFLSAMFLMLHRVWLIFSVNPSVWFKSSSTWCRCSPGIRPHFMRPGVCRYIWVGSQPSNQPDLGNSLWPGDTIWGLRSALALVPVKACCWTASSHCLNQCWLIISEVQCHSFEGNRWVSQMRALLAAYWEVAVDYNKMRNVLYVF